MTPLEEVSPVKKLFLILGTHYQLMPLFQKSVINKYISDLDKDALKNAWALYQAHFLNPTIQANIRDAKEEEYQEGFVRDLFVNILGYTLKPQPDYNFVLEKKTETDATKSDGAMLRGDSIIGVVELKDTGTAELDKIEKQVFGYKHKHKNCVYIITSNFEKLRFYINDATEYEEFDLFNLSAYRFTVLYVCLHQQHVQKDIPLAIKHASVAEEENVTKKLYADYSGFKRALFSNIVMLNPQYNKLELFKKTQKLLDRLLFIFFAEDRLLLPPNSIRKILKQWEQLKELDNYVPLYSRFNKYFGYLYTGHIGKEEEIFAYNGGLFEPDAILDNLLIDDKILHSGSFAISHYDFDSEVDVNILGHIFEHSLSEIEEVQAQLEGHTVDKTKTKRKKDGVFYTPRYITKYIVENTVGELCRQQKEKLGMVDDAFTPQKRKANTKQLQQKLDEYRNWLLQITICDPACGSGAFLNQALDFLIEEHRLIDELTARLFGSPMVLSDVETAILENNIFGVDINEEAVEIARLSLWLRTARKGRKLNNLSQNIKCGNSLIDDPAIAGDKAFNWQQEFATVFQRGDTFSKAVTSAEPAAKQGGFDVVIGNPPYVPIESLNEIDKSFFKDKFSQLERKYDLSVVFILNSLELISETGLLSFISSVTWQTGDNYDQFRKYLLNRYGLKEVINLPFDVFEDAYVDTCVYILSKLKTAKYNIYNYPKSTKISSFIDVEFESISLEKLVAPSYKLVLDYKANNILVKINSIPGAKSIDEISKSTQGLSLSRFESFNESTDLSFPLLNKGQAYRYILTAEQVSNTTLENNQSLKYYYEAKDKILIRRLISRQDRLLVAYTDLKLVFSKDINPFVIIDNDFETKFVLTILASKLISYLYVNSSSIATKDDFRQTTLTELRNIKIPNLETILQLPFIAKADIMLSKNAALQQVKQQLQQLLLGKYNGLTLSKKLLDWPTLPFAGFLKEMQKQKIKLTLPEEAEWLKYFEEQKAIANNLQQVIDTTDKEIDTMVYALYGLTEEEVRIVEGS